MTNDSNSIITPQVWELIRTSQPPYKGLLFQPVEYEFYMNLRFFLDNFAEYNPTQQQALAEWIEMMVRSINAMGVPCGIEMAETKGGRPV